MGLFTPKASPLIGVDFSSSAVKLLQLSQIGEHYRIEHYAVEALPAHAVVEKSIVDAEVVGEALHRALRRAGSSSKYAAAAVAGAAVITRIIQMPAELSEDDLEGQIQVEARQYIPYPIEEVSLDFEVLGTVPGNPQMNHVLLAAARAESIDMRVAALELGGLSARIIDVESFAMENAFALLARSWPLEREALIAIVDIGAITTTLTVLHQRRTIYVREQTFGGHQLTEEIAHRYGLSFVEAERVKRQGPFPESYVQDILRPFEETLARQVSQLLQFFFAGNQYSKIDQLVIAGGCALLEGIENLLQEELKVPCCIANPLAHMSLSPKVHPQTIQQDAPALMVALGLALRSFD